MKFDDIKVYLVQKSVPVRHQMQLWVDHASNNAGYELPEDARAAELTVAVAGKRCYNSFVPGVNPNVQRVRTDIAAFIDNILSSAHGSVLEHAVFSFGIEGITRVGTAELNRHRAGVAISEQSMRYCRPKPQDGIPFWMPLSLRLADDDDEETRDLKAATLEIIRAAVAAVEERYFDLVHLWKLDDSSRDFKYKKAITSLLRRILPMGICTGGLWTFNVRALRHVITMRCVPAAEEEICEVARQMIEIMIAEEPNLFGDFEKFDGRYWRPKYVKV